MFLRPIVATPVKRGPKTIRSSNAPPGPSDSFCARIMKEKLGAGPQRRWSQNLRRQRSLEAAARARKAAIKREASYIHAPGVRMPGGLRPVASLVSAAPNHVAEGSHPTQVKPARMWSIRMPGGFQPVAEPSFIDSSMESPMPDISVCLEPDDENRIFMEQFAALQSVRFFKKTLMEEREYVERTMMEKEKQERLGKKRLRREKLARVKARRESRRVEEERLLREQQAREEADRMAQRAEQERLQREQEAREEAERMARRAEQERLQREQQAREEAERMARHMEQERLQREQQAREQAEREARRQQELRDRLAEEQARKMREKMERTAAETFQRTKRYQGPPNDMLNELRRATQGAKEYLRKTREEERQREFERQRAEERIREFERQRAEQEARAQAEREARARAARERAERERVAKEAATQELQRKFYEHEYKWKQLKDGFTLRKLFLSELPWPVLCNVSGPDDITEAGIEEFLFHPCRPEVQEKSRRQILKMEVLRWHPDRFNSKVLAIMEEHEQPATASTAGQVVRILTEMMNQ